MLWHIFYILLFFLYKNINSWWYLKVPQANCLWVVLGKFGPIFLHWQWLRACLKQSWNLQNPLTHQPWIQILHEVAHWKATIHISIASKSFKKSTYLLHSQPQNARSLFGFHSPLRVKQSINFHFYQDMFHVLHQLSSWYDGSAGPDQLPHEPEICSIPESTAHNLGTKSKFSNDAHMVFSGLQETVHGKFWTSMPKLRSCISDCNRNYTELFI
jgi:hypothetical protein